jgi:hypothetical protein
MHRKTLALLVSQGAGMQSPRPGTIDEAQIPEASSVRYASAANRCLFAPFR